MKVGQWFRNLLLLTTLLGLFPLAAFAVQPVVKTVPWVASNPLIPHDTYPTKSIRLKGTADMQGAGITYTWDFGDGSPVATGTVTNQYAIEASHVYAGPIGTVWTATLTVTNTATNESASKQYYVKMEAKALPVEVNIAIDEGLWYLHKNQVRTTSASAIIGYWNNGTAGGGWYSNDASNVNAFEVNGHQESGNPDNPYTETVKRGMNRIFQYLGATGITSTKATGNPTATVNPDSNGNGLGVYIPQGNSFYQGGMFIDAIIASGTPNAVTATGAANIIGRTYKDIVQDMVDYYAAAQYSDNRYGGWRYSFNNFPDNSACQWAAIGLIPAERVWGLTVPAWVKTANINWLTYSQNASTGVFGYTDPNPIWGPYAVTPSGMVQMAMDGIGRGNVGTPSWNKAETFMRNNFCNGGGAGNAVRDYYYGLFSFTKSMLLHDSNGDKIAEPITLLQSTTPGVPPIDWYAAEASAGAPCDGVARHLISEQNAAGYWYGHNYTSELYPLETAFAIIMLHQTIFEAGAPVAVATATPNPAVTGQTITLSGAGSFHQDPTKAIDSWQWDLDNDGTYDATGPVVTTNFGALGNYTVKLRVTDNASPEASAVTTITVVVSIPPLAPTANAGQQYVFCDNRKPWFLDGSKSVNPDDGKSQGIGFPGDFIKSYAWDLDGDGLFDDAIGAQPDVTAFFTSFGSFLVQLKVTDNTAASYPASGQGDLSDTDSAQVFVKASTDPACACVSNLAARAKAGKIQLTWTAMPGVASYNVYRGSIAGGPYLKIANTTSTYATYLDQSVNLNNTYFYVVRAAAASGLELCQSNEASARATLR